MNEQAPDHSSEATCQDYQRRLLAGEWSGESLAVARMLLTHLDQCARCRTALKDYDRLRSALGSARVHHEAKATARSGESDATAEPVGGWADFECRLAAMPSAGFTAQAARAPVRRSHAPLLALAAMVLIALGGWGLYMGELFKAESITRQPGWVAAGEGRIDASPISSEEIQQRTALFESVSQVFEGRTSWVALAEAESAVGVSATAASSDRLLLVRLALSREGRKATFADLAILPSQAAQLNLPLKTGEHVRFHLKVNAQQRPTLALSVELVGTDKQQVLGALSTTLHPQPGQMLTVGELQTMRGRYHLGVTFVEAPRATSHNAPGSSQGFETPS